MIGSKRIVKASLLAALASTLAGGAAFAQQSHPPFNPAGVKLKFDNSVAPAAAVTHTGTVQVTFTITIKSTIPTSTPIYCTTNVVASDTGGLDNYFEFATATALRTGNTATCKASIPFQWVMSAAGGGYSVQYDIYAQSTTSLSGMLSTSALRETSRLAILAAPFPANGQTASYSYNIVL